GSPLEPGAGVDRIEPGLRRAPLLCGNFAGGGGHPSMRAGADAEVIVVAPIRQIVPALAARPGVIRDFVRRQPGDGETPLCDFVKTYRAFLIGNEIFATCRAGAERSAWLDRQLVQRQVVAGE